MLFITNQLFVSLSEAGIGLLTRNNEVYPLENLSLDHDDFMFAGLIKLQSFQHLFKCSIVFIQEFVGDEKTGVHSEVVSLKGCEAELSM